MTSSTRIEATRREANAVMTLRDDVERQLQRTLIQLEEANSQTRSVIVIDMKMNEKWTTSTTYSRQYICI